MISDIPYRIRLGVTGHRKFPDEEIITKKVREIFEKNRVLELFDDESKKFIASLPQQPVYSLLSPFAEGADRLVTKVVRNLPGSKIDHVSPLVEEDYLEDFDSHDSKNEYKELKKISSSHHQLRTTKLADDYKKEGGIENARRLAYEAAGHFIVNNCDVMIVIWDGKSSRGQGGTAKIKDYAIGHNKPCIVISAVEPYDISIERGVGLNAETFRNILKFNELKIDENQLEKSVDDDYRKLFESTEGKLVPEENKKQIREFLLPYYFKADSAADRAQKLFQNAGLITFSFAALAVIVSSVGTLFVSLSPIAYLLELLLMITALYVVFFSKRFHMHDRWIENRYLAERIRSSIFFAACGFEIPHIPIPANIGTMRKSECWMLLAFDEIWNRLKRINSCNKETCPLLVNFILKFWVQDQLKYHSGKAINTRKKRELLEKAGFIMLILAILSPVAHLLLFYHGHVILDVVWLEKANTLTALSLPAVSGAIAGILSHREYTRIEKRSLNMITQIAEIQHVIKRTGDPEVLKTSLREMDVLMKSETEEWLILMKAVELRSGA